MNDPSPEVLRRERRILTILIAALLGTAVCFRVMRLSSVPGVSGDEGWWGVQALAWLGGRPYQTHTTSGNPIDLFFLVPVSLVHTVARPSFVALRTIPALANLLALPIGFWFVRRLFGSATAWTYTVALAILPTAIAHSRICQDPSQTVFWTSLVIFLSLLGIAEPTRAWIYLGAAVATFPVALWTHPTNVFIAPFLLLPVVPILGPRLPRSWRVRVALLAAGALLLVAGLGIASLALNRLAGPGQHLDKDWLSVVAGRVLSASQWFELAANTARLFNGVTIYHYFSGARPLTLPYDVGFVAVAAAAGWGILRTSRRPVEHGLILACAATWVAFFAGAGPEALRPHFERWGLCLLVPGTLVLARGVAAWIERPRQRSLAIGVAAAVALGLLGSFYVNYFREFATTGGRSHLTYVTAPTEPKQQALERILATAAGPGGIAIVTQQWWLALPMTYLASERQNVVVTLGAVPEDRPGFQEAVRNSRLFFVEFAGRPESIVDLDWMRARGHTAIRTTIPDASGRDLVEILHVMPQESRATAR
jgi:hypothetical protein